MFVVAAVAGRCDFLVLRHGGEDAGEVASRRADEQAEEEYQHGTILQSVRLVFLSPP